MIKYFYLIFSYLVPTVTLAGSHGGAGPIQNNPGPITNPLTGVDSIEELITVILRVMVQVGLPIIAIFIIYTGFLFVTARGNESKLEEAKKAFFWTIIGAAIVLGAFVISTAIKTTVGNLGTGS